MEDNEGALDCGCSSEKEHEKLVIRVENSHLQDYDRDSERRKSAPTTETMRAKVLSQLNGHS